MPIAKEILYMLEISCKPSQVISVVVSIENSKNKCVMDFDGY